MHKKLLQILSIVILSVFLVSFTGVRLFMHECATCNSTEISIIQTEASCCSAVSETDNAGICEIPYDDNSADCCSTPASNSGCKTDDCCTDQVIYLVNDYDFSKERSQERVEPQVLKFLQIAFAIVNVIPADETISFGYFPFSEPPPKLSGKEFIIFSHQLKIS